MRGACAGHVDERRRVLIASGAARHDGLQRAGAICTEDGRTLSDRLEVTDSGPGPMPAPIILQTTRAAVSAGC